MRVKFGIPEMVYLRKSQMIAQNLCSLHRCSQTAGGFSSQSQLRVVLVLAKAPHL